LSTKERHTIQNDPAVQKVLTLFDGDVVDMRRAEPPDPAVLPPDEDSQEDEE
jgi:hypothetical protein